MTEDHDSYRDLVIRKVDLHPPRPRSVLLHCNGNFAPDNEDFFIGRVRHYANAGYLEIAIDLTETRYFDFNVNAKIVAIFSMAKVDGMRLVYIGENDIADSSRQMFCTSRYKVETFSNLDQFKNGPALPNTT